jgi:hypothetical protein
VERAKAIVAALPPFVTRVGLFVDSEQGAIEAVLSTVPMSRMGLPHVGAIRLSSTARYAGYARFAARFQTSACLLDSGKSTSLLHRVVKLCRHHLDILYVGDCES